MNDAAFAGMSAALLIKSSRRATSSTKPRWRAALDSGRLAGCAIDVGRARCRCPVRHRGAPDVIATPHLGGLTPQAIEHQAFDTVAQVARSCKAACPKAR